jgi:predicted nuclease of predicted toxin-antitoxin system
MNPPRPCFLLDEHLPRTAAEGLRRLGIDIRHVTEEGLAGRPDAVLFHAAGTGERTIVTRDHRDFLRLAAHPASGDRPAPALILVPSSIPQSDPGALVQALAAWVRSTAGSSLSPGTVAWLPAVDRAPEGEEEEPGSVRERPPSYRRALDRLTVLQRTQP